MTTNTDDKRVTDAYRDLADERAPAALDEKILAMAANEARTRYGFTRAWIRPVAWAATIGLSLAFLLEMSQLDETPVLRAPSTPAAEEAREQDRVADDAFVAEDLPLLREAEERARLQGGEARAVEALADAPLAAAPEAARLQKATAGTRKEAATPHCDDAARSAAVSWYACILELRQQGRADAAASELEALFETYPDFREPAPQ
jgi:hypothetical protein